MNGELLVKGYKFYEGNILNLQDKTVITGDDSFFAFEIFNMLENYFSRKRFSDYYLDRGTTLILNNNKLTGSEFIVFRMLPVVNIEDEIKLSKKSILGQAMQITFEEAEDQIFEFKTVIERTILNRLNSMTEQYGVSFACENLDIFTISKILQPVIKEREGNEIFCQEHDQFYCKAMVLDFITKLKTNKKKLLLIELPEYGLRPEEIERFLMQITDAQLDSVVIYTREFKICNLIPRIFNYNIVKNGKLYGFDDYDELEKGLQELNINCSPEEIEKKVLRYLFNFQSSYNSRSEFGKIVDDYLFK